MLVVSGGGGGFEFQNGRLLEVVMVVPGGDNVSLFWELMWLSFVLGVDVVVRVV